MFFWRRLWFPARPARYAMWERIKHPLYIMWKSLKRPNLSYMTYINCISMSIHNHVSEAHQMHINMKLCASAGPFSALVRPWRSQRSPNGHVQIMRHRGSGKQKNPVEPGGATSKTWLDYKLYTAERIQINRVPMIQQDGFSGLSQVLHPNFQDCKSWEVFFACVASGPICTLY